MLDEKIVDSKGNRIILSIEDVSEEKKNLEKVKEEAIQNIEKSKKLLEECQTDLYNVSVKELHIQEIYRLAKIQFSRIRKETEPKLTVADVFELEKLIKRTKDLDGLKRIVDSIRELQKFMPSEVRNLYALLQKIIIEGPFGETKKTRARK